MSRPLVAILTGAGISTDSGIPDYRGPRGLWTLHPEHEKLVTARYYMADPEIRRRSWQLRRETYARDPRPNAARGRQDEGRLTAGPATGVIGGRSRCTSVYGRR